LETRRVIHGHAVHFGEVMMRRGMVEELRDRVTDLVESRPIEIAQDDALPGFLFGGLDRTHLGIETFPSLAVEDQSVDPCPKLRIHNLREIILPPKIERQIGIEMGENDAWK